MQIPETFSDFPIIGESKEDNLARYIVLAVAALVVGVIILICLYFSCNSWLSKVMGYVALVGCAIAALYFITNMKTTENKFGINFF